MTKSIPLSGLFVFLLAPIGFAQEPLPAAKLYSRDNLVAWCIVPFDSKNRTPVQRAEMVKKLGFGKVAYDWRDSHVPTFEQEIHEYKKHDIEYFAFWSTHEKAFELFAKHDLHPQIWQIAPSPVGKTNEDRVAAAVKQMLPLVERTGKMGCKLGLYNHGGWNGEPENLVAMCKLLRDQHKAEHVGIVYNLHHAHDRIADFDKALAAMRPYLLCLNLNGMTTDGDKKGKKILPLGVGEHDLAMLKTIQASGYRGPIGIIGHTGTMSSSVCRTISMASIGCCRNSMESILAHVRDSARTKISNAPRDVIHPRLPLAA